MAAAPPEGDGEAFIAEFSIASPEIRALAEIVPDVELQMVEQFVDRDAFGHGVFWVLSEHYDRFDAALDDSSLIESWSCLAEVTDRRLYDIVVAEASELFDVIAISHEHHLVWQVMSAHHGRLFVRAIVPNRRSLQRFSRAVQERHFAFSLRRAIADLEPALGDRLSLTAPQREAVLLAYERGYYRQPREVSLEELGREIGISESAVSARIRRGLSNLIADCLGASGSASELSGAT